MSSAKFVYIYALIDPITNELRYIGKTINIKKRLSRHITERNLFDSYKDRWIRKLVDLSYKPIIIVIDYVLENEWEYWEKFYISYYKMIGCRLTNGTIGGITMPSNKGKKHSEERKRKNSEARKGKPIPWMNTGKERTEEHRKNLSNSLKGRKSPNKGKTFDSEYRKKLSDAHKGKNLGEKHPFYGKKHSQETIEKLKVNNYRNYKKVLQYKKDGSFIKEWNSATEAGSELGINRNSIGGNCRGELKTAGGFIWKFKVND